MGKKSKVNNWGKIFKYFALINYLTNFLYLGETDEYGWPVHDYESGLSGAIMDIYRDGENMYKNLRHEVDWEKEMRDFRKAATDALFKDIGDAVDDVDFEPIKDTTLDFLKHTRDILQSVDWNMFRAAGKRVMEAGKDSISEIHEKVSREPKSE